jgi:hypothetical protein
MDFNTERGQAMRTNLMFVILGLIVLCSISMRQQTQPGGGAAGGSGRAIGLGAPREVSVDVACGKNTVNWDAVAGAAGYLVSRGLNEDGSDAKPLGEVKAAELQYIDAAVPKERCFYFVRAVGARSRAAAAESRTVPQIAPAGLNVQIDWETQQATVTWAHLPNAIGYTVYYQKCSGAWDVAIGKQTAENSIKLSNITPQRWRFWVAANNECGEGPTSTTMIREPENNPVPCDPR